MNKKNRDNKKSVVKILQVLLVFSIYALIGGAFFLAYHLSGFTLNDLKDYLNNIGVWAYVLFIAVQVFTNVVLFIIPGQTLQFIALGLSIFSPLVTFLVVISGTVIASVINFLIGRLLGKRFVKRIIGQDTYHKYQHKLNTKAYVYYPLMMLLPFFPDDEITILAGLTKMNIVYFLFSTIVTRAVGVAIFTFLPGQIEFSYENNLELGLIIAGIIFIAVMLIYLIAQFERLIARLID